MKTAWSLLVTVLAVFALVATLPADDKDKKGKEVTLKGKITCAKCDLKQADECGTVIVVKEKDKDVVYWLDSEAHKKYHDDVCTSPKKGSVTGKVSKDGKKMVITVSKLEFAK